MEDGAKVPGRGSRRAVGVALLVSLALHALLLLGYALLPRPAEGRVREVVDTHIPATAVFIAPDGSPQQKPGSTAGEEFPQVKVDVVPVYSADAGAAPGVDVSTMPGISRGQGGANTGGPAGRGARFFGAPVAGQKVVFVIDRSLSMGLNNCLAAARAELLACLAALPPTARFQVVFYSRRAEPLPGGGADGLLPADATTLARVAALVRDARAEDDTDHLRALRCGLAFHPDVLFLVTDGDDLHQDQVREVTRINAGRTAIHAIDVGRTGRGAAALRRLARDNGGGYWPLDPSRRGG
jgi:hypothetical protein